MKTIVLYSYKGGLGKSLAASNLAVYLSRKGLNSVLLDMDLEAPTIHLKFPSTDGVTGKGGFAECFISNINPEYQIRDLKNNKTPWLNDVVLFGDGESDSIKPFPSKLEKYGRDISFRQSPKLKGGIFMLPSGDVYDSNYWLNITSPISQTLISLYEEFEFRRINKASFSKLLLYLLRFKKEISQIELNPRNTDEEEKGYSHPDYLIIDLRSGCLQVATTITSLWADDLLLFLNGSNNHLSHFDTYHKMLFNQCTDLKYKETASNFIGELDGKQNRSLAEEKYLRSIKNIYNYKDISLSKPKVIPVLSRVPVKEDYTSLIESAINPDFIELCAKSHPSSHRTDAKDVSILTTDPKLEDREYIHLGFNSEPDNSTLTHQYISLFTKIILDKHLECSRTDPLLLVKEKEAVGVKPHLDEFQRKFVYIKSTGALYNKDKCRNVSFKVETFQQFLFGIRENIKKSLTSCTGGKNKLSEDTFKESLENAGRQCGRVFGKSLADGWKKKEVDYSSQYDESIGIETKLQEWCKFDSDVGFGSFRLKSISQTDKELISCDIELIESFLTNARDFDSPFSKGWEDVSKEALEVEKEFCALMAGYIHGVIGVISGKEEDEGIAVTTDIPGKPVPEGFNSKTIIFKVKSKNKKNNISSNEQQSKKQEK